MITAKQCLARYGSPVHENNMMLWDVPEVMERSAIPGRVYCNRDMQPALAQAIVNLIVRNEVQNLKTWDGCFNIRQKVGGTSASLHSWGIAVDVNAAWNRYGQPPTMTPEFVKCWTDAGFEWGGTWGTPDGMHFQLKEFPT
jgi:hypothetical protein